MSDFFHAETCKPQMHATSDNSNWILRHLEVYTKIGDITEENTFSRVVSTPASQYLPFW